MIKVYAAFGYDAALHDLRECLARTHMHRTVAAALMEQLEKRLLHAGANTSDIITQYIATIKALRVIDPTLQLQGHAVPLICNYLKQRDDTIRCVVTSITEDREEFESDSNANVDEIIGLLVGIYGSPELFGNEYQVMLANRLLARDDFNTDAEIRSIELLKLRFGDEPLHHAEIMIRDIAESKRFQTHYTDARTRSAEGRPHDDVALSASIISHLFWPKVNEAEAWVPPAVERTLDEYATAFKQHKVNRQLTWKLGLGVVTVALEFDDGRTLQLAVSPLHAAIIYKFQEKATWHIDQLAEALSTSVEVLRKKISLWLNNRVLRESSKGVFEVVEILDAFEEFNEEEEEDIAASAPKDDSMEVAEKFVIGMLNTFTRLSLERIHSMLTNFVENYSGTIAELKTRLQLMVDDERLLFVAGEYSIKKK